jgi:hypothetical protein
MPNAFITTLATNFSIGFKIDYQATMKEGLAV